MGASTFHKDVCTTRFWRARKEKHAKIVNVGSLNVARAKKNKKHEIFFDYNYLCLSMFAVIKFVRIYFIAIVSLSEVGKNLNVIPSSVQFDYFGFILFFIVIVVAISGVCLDSARHFHVVILKSCCCFFFSASPSCSYALYVSYHLDIYIRVMTFDDIRDSLNHRRRASEMETEKNKTPRLSTK